MAERIDTPFANEHFAAFCLSMLGQPYWYGTCLYKCSQDVLSSKTKQYPQHYGESRTARYRSDIAKNLVCADCVGGCKGYAWTNGGQGVLESIGMPGAIPYRYQSNGCPDRSANGMFSYAKEQGMEWGGMDSMPEIVGLALHSDGHMGFYVGDGYAVEWRGFAYGCVRTKVSARNWQHWYKLPFIDYNDGAAQLPEEDYALGSRLLKRGMRGTDVKALQTILMDLGYSLPKYGADGSFGSETEEALKQFQAQHGLDPTGIYDNATHQALMDVYADLEGPVEENPPKPQPEPTRAVIVSGGGRVNIRFGNGTGFQRITQAKPGDTFPYVATAKNGWIAVNLGDRVGWVSGNYARIE